MKKSMLSVIPVTALTLSLVTGANALAEQNRFYLKADIGGNSARDVELREFFGEPTLAANSTISLDPGIRLGFRAGYGITDWFAAEVETGVTANNIESISGPTVAVADGSLANVPFLLNRSFLDKPPQFCADYLRMSLHNQPLVIAGKPFRPA
jgi:hypothetical protein